jgi:transcriptional regulator of acetoin/glycerol metabolism
VTQGRFLDRLYYRLNVMTLNVNDDVAWPIPRAVTKKQFIGPAR